MYDTSAIARLAVLAEDYRAAFVPAVVWIGPPIPADLARDLTSLATVDDRPARYLALVVAEYTRPGNRACACHWREICAALATLADRAIPLDVPWYHAALLS